MREIAFWQWALGMLAMGAILLALGLAVIWLEHRWLPSRRDEEDDGGSSTVRLAFEVLSAVFVVTGLLVCIYGDSKVLRALAGVAMIALVSTMTASLTDRVMRKQEGRAYGEARPDRVEGSA